MVNNEAQRLECLNSENWDKRNSNKSAARIYIHVRCYKSHVSWQYNVIYVDIDKLSMKFLKSLVVALESIRKKAPPIVRGLRHFCPIGEGGVMLDVPKVGQINLLYI